MPKQYKWFINYIFRKKKYLSAHMITVLISYPPKSVLLSIYFHVFIPGRVAQSVTCLATDACLTADPGVPSSIPARYHTFVEIDHEIISTVILLPSADLLSVTSESMCTNY